MKDLRSQVGVSLRHQINHISGLGFRFWGLGFGVLGFGVWGLGFGVWGLGFRVQDLGFGVYLRQGAEAGVRPHEESQDRFLAPRHVRPFRALTFQALPSV